ncbi:MAG TPA: endonuclease [Candidatus Ozemobacteraceae bacterium]|nr:endonuclease [Candidatus Ozemobacteraceae bacterium]
MTLKNLKTGVLLLGFAVASGAMQVSAQEGFNEYSAREKMLRETLQLLDRVENAAPTSHADLVKIRERVLAIHKTAEPAAVQSADENPEIMFSRQAARRNKRAKNRASRESFYNSVRGLRNGQLRSSLQAEISTNKFFDYGDARRLVMLDIDNHDGHIECVYTGKIIPGDEMPKATVMNIEHTWPQSKGATGIAKADMHHLFPTDPVANSTRSSLPFGEVEKIKWEDGGSKCDQKRFEVRPKYRGNSARAIFYFSVRYGKSIGADEENTLRAWHKEDPVDAEEKQRNDKVESIQGNRNPFIDHPEYVEQIADF